jgi:hypothetical protein
MVRVIEDLTGDWRRLELGGERRHLPVSSARETIIDRDRLSVEFTEAGQERRIQTKRRRTGKDPYHRQRRLGARRERSRRSAAEDTKKLPPPHVRPQAQEATSYRFSRVL